jgi:hypothetical protein
MHRSTRAAERRETLRGACAVHGREHAACKTKRTTCDALFASLTAAAG